MNKKRNFKEFSLLAFILLVCLFFVINSAKANPVVNSFSPADNATGVSVSSNLVVTFDQSVSRDDMMGQYIYIKKSSDDSIFESFPIGYMVGGPSARISGWDTSTITIDPTTDLSSSTDYYVQIDPSGFHNAYSYYAGIVNTTTWNFSTGAGGGGSPPTDWLGSAWTKRIRISVNASQVNGSVSNFPVYVNLNHLPAAFFDDVLANGADLRVTKSDGTTQVAREVVFLNKTTNAGELHFVANGTLSNASNGVFYLYYGNGTASEPAANATYGKNNVWVNNYAGVWHMNEAVNNNAGGYTDSTSNTNHANGISMALTEVSGKLSGKAQDLDGTADYIQVPNSSSLENVMEASYTLSAWHYPDEVPNNVPWYNSFDSVICRPGNHAGIFFEYNSYYQITTQATGGNDATSTPTTFSTSTWHHAVQIINTSNTTQTLFVDGTQRVSASYSGSLRDFSTTPFKFGTCGTPGPDWDWVLNGKLDEIRISSTNRNGSWVKTEYNNQSSPSTFYAVQTSPSSMTTPSVLGFSPGDGTTGVSRTANLVITFDRKIDIQTGNITIKKSSDNSTVETISVTGGLVSGNGTNQITINPSLNFASNNGYYIQIDASAFDDTGGNSYAGIADTTTWNFTSNLLIPTDWLHAAWTKRVKLSINASQINGSVSNFPVYVNLNHLPAAFFDEVLANGADLRVTKSDGTTQVAREVVFLNKTTNAGELHFVANGTLSNASNGIFYLYYGNGTATEPTANSTYGKNNVWVNNYAGVWHMNEAVNNSPSGYTDSTSNSNHANGISMALTEVSGKLSGKAQDLDGTADYIQVPNSSSLENVMEASYTLSAWHYPDEVPSTNPMWYNRFDAVVCRQGQHSGIFFEYNAFYQATAWTGSGNDVTTTPTTFSDNAWHHTAQIINTSNTTQTLFVDGTQRVSASYSGGLRDYSTTPFRFGTCSTPGQDWDWVLNGKLDEIRISSTNRNGSWIKTEYNNQSSPSTFYSVASKVTSLTPFEVLGFSPENGSTGIAVDANLVIVFDRLVDIQTGNITIKKVADNSTVATIDVTSGLVTGNGTATITINPSSELPYGTQYYVQIDSTAFDDTAENDYAGIADTTTWRFTTKSLPSDWLQDGTWANRIKIEINKSQINGSVTNFPVYINLNGMPASFTDNCLANGADLRVTKSDGTTQVAREIVFLNRTSNAGEMHFVANGTIANTSNAVFYLYYNNSSATEPSANATYGKNNVWTEGFVGIWHLNEDPDSSNYLDSTSSVLDGSPQNLSGDNPVTSKMGYSPDFDGTNEYISVPNGYTNTIKNDNSNTICFWANYDAVGNQPVILNANDLTGTGMFSELGSNAFYWADGSSYRTYTVSMSSGTWYHFCTSKTAATTGDFYFNSTLQSSYTGSFAASVNSNSGFYFANYKSGSYYLDGKIDEMRISNVSRSGSWIKTEYNNQNSPNTFSSISSAYSLASPVVIAFSPSDNSTEIPASSNLVITFDRKIDIQTGNITIKKTSDNSTVHTIDVTSGLVTGNGTTTITINPSSDLAYNTQYYVQIDSTAFDDTGANSYAGIADTTTWNFTTDSSAKAWLNNAWSKRLKLIVDDSKVNGTVLNFPVYVNLANLSSSNFFNVARSDGADIRITQGDGLTELPYELVSFNSTSNAGELHFRAPHLSSSSNANFYLYYGNSNARAYNATHSLGSNAVWSNGYLVVYHMAQSPNGDTASAIRNSVSNAKHASPAGSMTTGDLVSCQLGDCLDFDGSNDKITFTASAITTGSVSCWTYSSVSTASDNTQGFLGIYPSTALLMGHPGSSYSGISMYNASWYTANGSTTSTNTWYHHTGNFGGSGIKYYKNGVKGTDSANTTAMPAGTFQIGIYPSATYEFTGRIDEFRLSTKTRDGNWIKTEYNNQNSPTSFYRISSSVEGNGDDSFPKIISLYPATQSIKFSPRANLKMMFNEAVSASSGNIYIYRANGNTLLETIAIGSGNVTGSGSTTITINPTSNLPSKRTVYVLMDSGTLVDGSSNAFQGITNPFAWRFATEGGTDNTNMFQMNF